MTTDDPYRVSVHRPAPTATWKFDTYEGAVGSAMHHVHVTVSASYQATRPDPNGLPNRITIKREQDRGEKTIYLERTAAQALVDMLTEALAWEGDAS